MRKIKN